MSRRRSTYVDFGPVFSPGQVLVIGSSSAVVVAGVAVWAADLMFFGGINV